MEFSNTHEFAIAIPEGINRQLTDFDVIKEHNLDRQLGSTKDDIGELKVDVAKRQIKKSATAKTVSIEISPYNVGQKDI